MARIFPILSFALFSLVHGAEKSFNIAARRESGRSPLGKRSTATDPSALDSQLYWYSTFSVGDSGPLSLLVDTGSSDILIDPGYYHPSANAKPYITHNYSIQYEGVTKAGEGFELINGTALLDNVTVGGLTVKHQALANITSYKFFDLDGGKAPQNRALARDGIIGFGSQNGSTFMPQAESWFYNLCAQKSVDECRFGLAFGTNRTGQLVLGKFDSALTESTVVPVKQVPSDGIQYLTTGDVTLDNKIVSKNQTFVMDVGTNNIQGPIGPSQQIFDLLGYVTHLQTSNQTGTVNKVLTASFACAKPPTLGFSFPAESQLKKGEKATIFNVSPDVWDTEKVGHGNCTSVLAGTNFLTNHSAPIPTMWLLGAAFFAGHYIDFDISSSTVSYANLKNPATGT